MDVDLPRARRTAAIGLAVGTVAGWAIFLLIFGLFAEPVAANTADRLAYATQWLFPLAVLLFAMAISISLARNFSPAIDPTIHAETRFIDISRRVLTNTVEQGLIFALLAFVVAAAAPAAQLGVLAALAVMFVLSRIAFWIGYLKHPLHRAFGAMSFQINFVMIVWAIIVVITR